MTAGRRLGIVTGLPAEARALGRDGKNFRVMCSAASPARARAQAQTLAAWGADGLASVGIAGGLDAGLRPGTVIIATRIVAPGGGVMEIDDDWADRLAAALPATLAVVRAPVAGSDCPVANPAARAAIAEISGAAAVDMESHAVARIGAEAGLGVMALRVIADAAGRRLPVSLVAALSAEGGPRARRVLLESFRRPGDLPALAGLAVDYRRALAVLRRVVAAGGPDIGFFG